MFIENKYKKWYDLIIENAKTRQLSCYVERHHILPKCLGGTNESSNIVELTAREHYVCHLLLTKCVTGTFYKSKMLHALGMFVQCNSDQERNFTSRQYEVIRTAISEAKTGKPRSEETKRKISEGLKGNVPWNKGLKLPPLPDERKQQLSEMFKGRPLTQEWRENISKGKIGKSSGMLGKKHSNETKELMSKNMKGARGPQKRIEECPYCLKNQVTSRHVKFCKRNKDADSI